MRKDRWNKKAQASERNESSLRSACWIVTIYTVALV